MGHGTGQTTGHTSEKGNSMITATILIGYVALRLLISAWLSRM